jgi:type VI protein secretion system component VasK
LPRAWLFAAERAIDASGTVAWTKSGRPEIDDLHCAAVRWLAFIVGALATVYVAVLWILHQTCDTSTCVSTPAWRWIVFAVIGIVGLVFSLGPWSRKRHPARRKHLSLREAMQKPRLPPDRRR